MIRCRLRLHDWFPIGYHLDRCSRCRLLRTHYMSIFGKHWHSYWRDD